MKEIRTLKPEEIQVRVQKVGSKTATFLLYVNSRTCMDLLDETYGPLNWKREHTRDNQNCVISVWNPEIKEWVSREDTGTESNTEKEKGEASDSFKRAAVNFGVARELYSAPVIKISKKHLDIYKNSKGKDACSNNLYVAKIAYDDNRAIAGLQLKDCDTDIVLFNRAPKTVKNSTEIKNEAPVFAANAKDGGEELISEEQANIIRDLVKEHGLSKAQFLKRFEAGALMDLTSSQADEGIEYLEKLEKRKFLEDNTSDVTTPASVASPSPIDAINSMIEKQNEALDKAIEEIDNSADNPIRESADVISFEETEESVESAEDNAVDDENIPSSTEVEEYGEVLFECNDDASDNMKDYIGVAIKDLPVAIMKPFARANSAIAKKVPEDVAEAIRKYYDTVK